MSILLPEDRLDALVTGYRRYILMGFVLAFIASKVEGFAVLSAFTAMWLGACGGSLQAWKTERGLWMLSSLFLVIALGVYCLLQYGIVIDLFQNRRAPAWVAADTSLGMAMLLIQTRLLLTISIRNWQAPAGA